MNYPFHSGVYIMASDHPKNLSPLDLKKYSSLFFCGRIKLGNKIRIFSLFSSLFPLFFLFPHSSL